MNITAIILAAGSGKRMGSGKPKQYIDLSGKPLLYYAVKAFEKSCVNRVVIVVPDDDKEYVKTDIVDRYGFAKVTDIVAGGTERYDSVLEGLKAVSGSDIVMIHDGARPFISPDIIDKMALFVEKNDAAIAAMPVKDTIKISDNEGYISTGTERKNTWAAQTPQVFRYDLILNAYLKVIGSKTTGDNSSITDDAMVFSMVYPEKRVRLFEAGYENIKITTPEDLAVAEIILNK